jgi:hypothetical protein
VRESYPRRGGTLYGTCQLRDRPPPLVGGYTVVGWLPYCSPRPWLKPLFRRVSKSGWGFSLHAVRRDPARDGMEYPYPCRFFRITTPSSDDTARYWPLGEGWTALQTVAKGPASGFRVKLRVQHPSVTCEPHSWPWRKRGGERGGEGRRTHNTRDVARAGSEVFPLRGKTEITILSNCCAHVLLGTFRTKASVADDRCFLSPRRDTIFRS